MKKVKTTMPYIMNEKIKEDEIHFKLTSGSIGNKVFAYYRDKNVERSNLKAEKGQALQFNLTKENEELYLITLKEHEVDTDAEFLRDILYKYLNNPRYTREEILFFDIFQKIKEGIEQKKKINIKYNKEIRTVSPYMIKVSPGEDRSYLFCYCDENKEYRNYRIANIEVASLSKYDVENNNEDYVKKIGENFDPFLSYGKKVIVRITETGEKIYESAIMNRPKLLEKNGDIWTFQCAPRLAQIYFPQFLSSVEILEPVELKEWFKKEFEEILKKYK